MTKSIWDSISQLVKNIGSGWDGDEIFVIGKGPSLDELEGFSFPPSLIINVNDSEKIFQGQLGIFSANWVRHSLKERGFGCSFYLAGKPLPSEVPHAVLPAIPLDYDDDDLSAHRLGMDEFYDEPFVLLNALKVCLHLARQHRRKPTVYLLGFDFSTAKGEVSRTIGVDYANTDDVDRSLMVHSHEYGYLQLSAYFRDNPVINLVHVGIKSYSEITPAQLRERFSPRVTTSRPSPSSVTASSPNQVLVVAELTNNHLGDGERLVEMIERAKDAGADLIKVQKRDVASFYSAEKLNSYYSSPFGKTLGDYRRGVELDEGNFELLDRTCRSLEIDWFCSVLDYPSFETLQKFSPQLIKIPSTISNHRDFHSQIAAEYKGPIVISTGYTDQSYESYVLETFARNEKIFLLHCVSSYPTTLSDCNVAVVRHYAELAEKHPSVIPGYSSHDLGSFASALAVACGARMVEKHVKLGDVEWIHFDTVAIDLKTDSFKNYVRDIRQAEVAFGSPEKRVLSSEHHKYEVATDH